jgi:hypothetical protein
LALDAILAAEGAVPTVEMTSTGMMREMMAQAQAVSIERAGPWVLRVRVDFGKEGRAWFKLRGVWAAAVANYKLQVTNYK